MRKKKKQMEENIMAEEVISLEKKEETLDLLKKGVPTELELLLPSGLDRSDAEILKVGDKYVKSFILSGFPRTINVSWLDKLYNSEEDVDVAVYAEPFDERAAIEELSNDINKLIAQRDEEAEKGKMKNLSRLEHKIRELEIEKEKIEQNYTNLFYVQIAANMYNSSKEDLGKQYNLIDNYFQGRKVKIMPAYLQQDEGYKTALPFGRTYLRSNMRNFSSEALIACFPFYNSEISHKTGIYMGLNVYTNTPMYIDFFDRKLLPNGNMTIFGVPGSGKTFFTSLFIMRSILNGIRMAVIDPEEDYIKLTKALGGVVIDIMPGSENFINPFELEEEDVLDEEGFPTGEKVVNIKEKISDLLNLIGVMAGEITSDEQGVISQILKEIYYEDFGFTESVDSIYENSSYYNEETESISFVGKKKVMPRFTDFHDMLTKYANSTHPQLQRLVDALSMFKEGGVYDLFDCYTSENLINFKDSPIVTFNVYHLEDKVLRPIGMHVALSWCQDKFIKRNPTIAKTVVVDEAWMMIKKSMKGHEFTGLALENIARRSRKRRGSLVVASQGFAEFANSEEGKVIINNSAINIFFKQDSTSIETIQRDFHLSSGEAAVINAALKGEFLLRMKEASNAGFTTSVRGFAHSFDFERELIERKALKADLQKNN